MKKIQTNIPFALIITILNKNCDQLDNKGFVKIISALQNLPILLERISIKIQR